MSSVLTQSHLLDDQVMMMPSPHDDVEKPSIVGAGIANLGNTCFLNAVLQCVTHTVLFIRGLNLYTRSTPCDCNGERFCLLCALSEHIDHTLSSTSKVVSPVKFVDNLSFFSSTFRRLQQEDAHEFLQCFLDKLESSCSFLKTKDVAFSSEKENLVKQLFGGRVVSKLRCCNCNHSSDTYEPSVNFSLEIENAHNLTTALESFTKAENLENEETKFTCDKCNQNVSVEKQLMLDQAPPVCAFHFKRFKNDGSIIEKIDKHVEFPLELDLQPYTCGNRVSNEELKYELYAVIVHMAFTSTCGHYYSYIRSAPQTWYKFDDSQVIKVSEEQVLSAEAYILFYTKQDTPSFSNFMKTYKPSMDSTLSKTSPKSVLENVDHHSTYPSHNSKYPYSFDRLIYNKTKVAKSNFPPLETSNSFEVTSPLSHKVYITNHRLSVQANHSVTPMRLDKREFTDIDDHKGVYATPLVKPSYPSGGKTAFRTDNVSSPLTPPPSPGIDVSDHLNSEVVFAPTSEQLKLVEKTACKRPRHKEVLNCPKTREAWKDCRKLPGARGALLMAALDASLKSQGMLHKKSKKNVLSPRKKGSHSKQHNLTPRNLATSSF
ncbi:Peptidase C19, ubiquitin carboxyl-terminal hydrolase 2 [Artemisia annua]|uniref:ubiquitinyl hydrolase 1 n=1 Tax=Artemisia annua TaxID=35608 RepID=A0A2U1MF00_ARTAN|nr:Peptidase C19, ubiquitin carboxyl-terminal hydrolase 2 [Artemisia annua]